VETSAQTRRHPRADGAGRRSRRHSAPNYPRRRNIYPREIEEVLYTHPGVIECAVIGIPDEVRGEEVLAVVAPKPGAELDVGELREFAARHPSAFKVPRRVEIRSELPKHATGRILNQPLREDFGYWAVGR
jgi:long-chain acyl-CoA synthetase